jgi:hypothetical protein
MYITKRKRKAHEKETADMKVMGTPYISSKKKQGHQETFMRMKARPHDVVRHSSVVYKQQKQRKTQETFACCLVRHKSRREGKREHMGLTWLSVVYRTAKGKKGIGNVCTLECLVCKGHKKWEAGEKRGKDAGG